MARPLRLNYAGAFYHVTARGNARQAIVRDDRDRARFVDTLAQLVERYGVRCHAWVLMTNHYHLLLETPTPNLSLALRHLNGVYTQWFNRRHRRVGHVFQGRFTAIVVQQEAHGLELCRYVVLNPVRAGMVSHPGRYAWSSYRATAGSVAAPAWLTVDWILEQFGAKRRAAQEAYRAFVQEDGAGAPSPWSRVVGQVYLGSDAFIARVLRQAARVHDPEIPRQQREPLWLTADAVLHRVARAYGVTVATLTRASRRPGEARQVTLYGLRRHAGLGLRPIARRMGVSYSGVSRRVRAVEARLGTDRRFRRRVEASLDVKVKT